MIEEEHEYHGNSILRVTCVKGGNSCITIYATRRSLSLSRSLGGLLTNTQLHDVGIVGPADNGQDEEHRNPLEHSHATAARCRLPSPIIVVAHARVWLLGSNGG